MRKLSARLFGYVASVALLSGCNLGQVNAGSEAPVEGYWSGTYSPPGVTQSAPALALIRKGGVAFFYDATGVVYRLPTLDGGDTVQGEVTAYAPIGYRFATGYPDEKFTIQGTAASTGISGILQNATGTGNLSLLSFDNPDSASPVKPGQWSGYYITPTPSFVSLTVDANGTLTGDDAFGCHLTGTINENQPGENLFDVTLDSSGPAPVCGGQYTGLAREADYDSFGYFEQMPGTYYYMGVVGQDRAFVAEFKVE
jgi:hypothetical protein